MTTSEEYLRIENIQPFLHNGILSRVKNIKTPISIHEYAGYELKVTDRFVLKMHGIVFLNLTPFLLHSICIEFKHSVPPCTC